jgi:hypothetical protein
LAPKGSCRLVIDASVARASGGPDATAPLSIRCRDFLFTTLHVCHRLVMTDAINDEWNDHQSNFARRWRVQMVARKKVEWVEAPGDEAFGEQVAATAQTKGDREAILKDMLLVEAALATDHRIVALDEAVRGLLDCAARCVGVLRNVLWVNPSCEEERPLDWLNDRARNERHRRLGQAPEEEPPPQPRRRKRK